MAEKKDETQGSEIPDEEKLSQDTSETGQPPEEKADIVDAEFEEIREDGEPTEERADEMATEDAFDPARDDTATDDADEVEDQIEEPEVEVVEPDPEPQPDPMPPVPQETVIEKTVVQKRGFMPLFLGGVIAAVLGFAAARLDLPPGLEASLPEALRQNVRVSHQARAEDHDRVTAFYAEHGISADVQPFFHDVPNRMAEAQLVITRAG